MASEQTIRSFWNRAAAENPYWYVSSYGPYDASRNIDEFWASGNTVWSDIKRVTGYKPEPVDTTLEIGCGVGRLTRVIAPEVGRVIAFDISEKMLAIAQQAGLTNVDFRIAEGFKLPAVPDQSMDLALAYCVFQHLPSDAALKSYLDEMYRVTKPGGTIAFTLVARDWKTWLLPVLRLRAFFRECLCMNGPKGVYRKEWVGIRPGCKAVSAMISMRLNSHMLDGGRLLYFGVK
jgi:SAM-dependent methyltransferase